MASPPGQIWHLQGGLLVYCSPDAKKSVEWEDNAIRIHIFAKSVGL